MLRFFRGRSDVSLAPTRPVLRNTGALVLALVLAAGAGLSGCVSATSAVQEGVNSATSAAAEVAGSSGRARSSTTEPTRRPN